MVNDKEVFIQANKVLYKIDCIETGALYGEATNLFISPTSSAMICPQRVTVSKSHSSNCILDIDDDTDTKFIACLTAGGFYTLSTNVIQAISKSLEFNLFRNNIFIIPGNYLIENINPLIGMMDYMMKIRKEYKKELFPENTEDTQ